MDGTKSLKRSERNYYMPDRGSTIFDAAISISLYYRKYKNTASRHVP